MARSWWHPSDLFPRGNGQPLAKQLINVSLAVVGEVPTKRPDMLNITVESYGRMIAFKLDIYVEVINVMPLHCLNILS
jgi:hypothetical protein